jgi:hypothetical protein
MTNTTDTTDTNWKMGEESDIICRHRDLSCCDTCAAAHTEIIAVEGKHFWVEDRYEREMLAEMGY